MQVRSFLLAVNFIAALSVHAQPVLLPSIGLDLQPSSSDQICTLPFQTPPIETNGRPAGENAADFSLYDLQGDQFNLEEALLQGKPVLMIAGSYTCPVFRNKIPLINEIQATYADQLTTVIVYTAEAHPDIDISPYYGAVNTHAANFAEGILYMQPTTYGERSTVAADMLDAMPIDVPILIDGPCNEWWNYYGPAPNIAYLIDVNGMIFSRHGWLDKFPQDINCDIDSLLGMPADCVQELGGSFGVEWLTNDTMYGDIGTTITVTTRIINPSQYPVLVEVHRLENNMPDGWSSSLCLDVCYLPDVDYTEIIVQPNSQQDFHYYFYTSEVSEHGHARVGLRNAEDFSNGHMLNFHGFSTGTVSINDLDPQAGMLMAWPNPATGSIQLQTNASYDRLVLRDVQGRIVWITGKAHQIDVSNLADGLYSIQAFQGSSAVTRSVRIVKL